MHKSIKETTSPERCFLGKNLSLKALAFETPPPWNFIILPLDGYGYFQYEQQDSANIGLTKSFYSQNLLDQHS